MLKLYVPYQPMPHSNVTKAVFECVRSRVCIGFSSKFNYGYVGYVIPIPRSKYCVKYDGTRMVRSPTIVLPRYLHAFVRLWRHRVSRPLFSCISLGTFHVSWKFSRLSMLHKYWNEWFMIIDFKNNLWYQAKPFFCDRKVWSLQDNSVLKMLKCFAETQKRFSTPFPNTETGLGNAPLESYDHMLDKNNG